MALRARFEHTESQSDLDAAIDSFRVAAAAIRAARPDLVGSCLFNLGIALHRRFEVKGFQTDWNEALSALTQAASLRLAEPSIRIWAARDAATLTAETDPSQAAGLLDLAVRLLPEVAPRQLQRTDQQHALGGFAGLASDAAALVLAGAGADASADDRAVRALALLEKGRAVLLSQALDTRSDLSDLRQRNPILAGRFAQLRELLDQVPGSTTNEAPFSNWAHASDHQDEPGNDRYRLAEEFTTVIEQIRALDGFASFGRPPTVSDLLQDGVPGPVVAFNISTYRSDALLLTSNRVASIALPGLRYDNVLQQINSFRDALGAVADPQATLSAQQDAQEKISRILEWLWDNAAGPVLETLGYHRSPPDGTWPRVWWMPGGLLGLLPIHAAGHHNPPEGDSRRAVMDCVISSYTPTIRALRYARQHIPVGATADRSLIVAMPITPGLSGGDLPSVHAEIDRVGALLPDPLILAESAVTGEPVSSSSGLPTRANVFAHLPGCSIAHFACHGATDPSDPSQSLLLLHDHDRNPLTVASLAPVNLAHAQLAYLSACDTAYAPATTLLDEAIHLTTAFQLAGFPHVIGTLWQIGDRPTVRMAESFYGALLGNDGKRDLSQAALALHHAVHALRDRYPKVPSVWAAYLHAGS
jgi:hypothetical protein